MRSIYTPLAQCVARVHQQTTDALAAEIAQFARIPDEIAYVLADRPLALFRWLITPNFETLRFLDMAESIGVSTTFFTLPSDIFMPGVNADKKALGKICVETSRGARSVRILNFNAAEGQPLRSLRCANGELLPHFHRRLAAQFAQADAFRSVDATLFINGERPQTYYERFLSLFICNGILAETFCFEGSERRFTEEVVLPALEAITDRFGLAPVIVELLPESSACSPHWTSYSAHGGRTPDHIYFAQPLLAAA